MSDNEDRIADDKDVGGFEFLPMPMPKLEIHRGRYGNHTEVIVWIDEEGEVAYIQMAGKELYVNPLWRHLLDTFQRHTKEAIENFEQLQKENYVRDGKTYRKFVINFSIT